jgi:Trehalose utilisation
MSRRPLLALVALVLFIAPSPAAAPKKLLLVGCGPDGHPPQTHEYMDWLKVLEKCLKGTPGLEVTLVKSIEPWREGPELMARADGVVLFISEGARWLQQDPKRLEALRQVAARKGGLAVIHWGMGTKDAKYIDNFVKLFGACHGGPDRKYKVLETEVKLAALDHPAARGLPGKFRIKEEFYYRLKRVKPATGLTPLVTAAIDGKDEMVGWVWARPDGGRSFGFSGLHFHANWGREEYRRLVAQSVLWTLGLPIPEKGLSVPSVR